MRNEKMRKWEMIIYGIENCGYCTELKEGLKKINIPFIYINISNNEELGDKIEEIYKCPVYPIISLKYPQQITWLSGTSLLRSPSIRTFDTIKELITNIKNIYDN